MEELNPRGVVGELSLAETNGKVMLQVLGEIHEFFSNLRSPGLTAHLGGYLEDDVAYSRAHVVEDVCGSDGHLFNELGDERGSDFAVGMERTGPALVAL